MTERYCLGCRLVMDEPPGPLNLCSACVEKLQERDWLEALELTVRIRDLKVQQEVLDTQKRIADFFDVFRAWYEASQGGQDDDDPFGLFGGRN